MVVAEDIRRTILKLADERGPMKTFAPAEVARRMDHENWQIIIDQVRLVALVLVREGKIKTTRSGDSVDFIKAR